MNIGKIYSFSPKVVILHIWMALSCLSSFFSRINTNLSTFMHGSWFLNLWPLLSCTLVWGYKAQNWIQGSSCRARSTTGALQTTFPTSQRDIWPFCNVYVVSSTYSVWPRLIQILPCSCTAWPFISPPFLWRSPFTQAWNFVLTELANVFQTISSLPQDTTELYFCPLKWLRHLPAWCHLDI